MKKIINVNRELGLPLVGSLPVGIIDRGTNLLQIRATTLCNLKCVYCSTNANSDFHPVDYVVDLNYLLQWFKEVVKQKGVSIEANLDSVGETFAYPKIMELVKELGRMKEVHFISCQTNGTLLTKEKIDLLEEYGLGRINLSFDAVNKDIAVKMSGTSCYNFDHVKDMAEYIATKKIELFLTPVWVPGMNDKDMEDLIIYSKKIGAKLAIQKLEYYKYGRNPKAKTMTWWKFFNKLEEWEKKYGVKLKLGTEDIDIRHCKSMPIAMEKGEKFNAVVVCPGWQKDQVLAAARNRSISILNCNKNPGDAVKVEILSNKDNIYVAKQADNKKSCFIAMEY